MDLMFSSKLQTALQKFGRENGFAPPKSQDPADAVLHEYYVAETGRSLFDKRRKVALENLQALDRTGVVEKALKDAAKGITGNFELVSTENYGAVLTTKTPTKKFDQQAAKNALIKAGVSSEIVEAAFKSATSQNKAAETYTVSVKTT